VPELAFNVLEDGRILAEQMRPMLKTETREHNVALAPLIPAVGMSGFNFEVCFKSSHCFF
jgi:hypothetical protein